MKIDLTETRNANELKKFKIDNTIINIPQGQLVRAHKLADKTRKELCKMVYKIDKIVEELKDAITITY